MQKAKHILKFVKNFWKMEKMHKKNKKLGPGGTPTFLVLF